MLMARDGGGMSRDRWSRVAPYLSIQFGQQMTDVVGAHIGVSLSPSTHISPSLSTGRGDDDFVKELMRTIGVVKELAFRPEENGIFTCEGSTEPAERRKAPFAAVITGTGEFSARLRIGYRTQFSKDVEDLANVLAISYNLSARHYRRKRFGPLVQMRVVIANQNKAQRLVAVLLPEKSPRVNTRSRKAIEAIDCRDGRVQPASNCDTAHKNPCVPPEPSRILTFSMLAARLKRPANWLHSLDPSGRRRSGARPIASAR